MSYPNFLFHTPPLGVDDMVEELTKLFLDIARQCIPTKTITVGDYDKPWFNNEIRKEIRLRDRLRKKCFQIWEGK